MNANNTQASRGRSGEISSAGFRQFYREWQPRDEAHPPVLALHGSLTQSGMWIELAGRIGSLCPTPCMFRQQVLARDAAPALSPGSKCFVQGTADRGTPGSPRFPSGPNGLPPQSSAVPPGALHPNPRAAP